MRQHASAIPTPTEVRCIECDRLPEGPATGWKAYLGGGYDKEPVEVVIYCPECAERECGVDSAA
jgi:hypothetical protein